MKLPEMDHILGNKIFSDENICDFIPCLSQIKASFKGMSKVEILFLFLGKMSDQMLKFTRMFMSSA